MSWKKTIKKDDSKMSPQWKAALYLEDKDKELLELEKLYKEYQEKGREILEKIWADSPFDDNSRESRELETLVDKEYEAHGIAPEY